MSLQVASPLVEAFYSTITQAACVAAVIKGCEYSLRRWIAISSLTPPEAVLKPQEPIKSSKWKPRIIGIVVFVLIFAFEGGLVFGVQSIKSEFWFNAFWAILEGLLIASVMFSGSVIAFPTKTSVSYIANKMIPGAVLLKEKHESNMWPRVFGGVGASALCIYLSSQGIRGLQPAVVAAWVLTCSATAGFPKMNVKWVNIIVMGYITIVPLLGAIVGGIIVLLSNAFSWEDSPASAEPSPQVYGWLGRVMMIMGYGLPSMIPSVLIAMALRFDHAQTRSTIALRLEPGQAIIIPTSAPEFAKPMFRASVGALVGALVVAEVLTSFFEPTHMIEMVWMCLTIPTVSAVQLIQAKRMGMLKDWWKYEEIWVPSKKEVAKISEDVEAVAGAEKK